MSVDIGVDPRRALVIQVGITDDDICLVYSSSNNYAICKAV